MTNTRMGQILLALSLPAVADSVDEMLEKARAELRRLQGTSAFRFSRRLRQHRSAEIQTLLSDPDSDVGCDIGEAIPISSRSSAIAVPRDCHP